MNEQEFRAIYRELMDENPFAARAALKVLRLEFTSEVPTLAVTLETQPRMLVNLEFVARSCRGGNEVKAAICHEFLHVLLRHTERFQRMDPVQNIALDAVINAIIHRDLGPDYSSLMGRLYAGEKGLGRILRPPRDRETYAYWHAGPDCALLTAWHGIYDGKLIADDILDVARDVAEDQALNNGPLLGNHQDDGPLGDGALPAVLADALDRGLKSMNGHGIWRAPKDRGIGASVYRESIRSANADLGRWRYEAYEVLRRHLEPDAQSTNIESQPYEFALPVLSNADRRAALRSLWSPFLPEAIWSGERRCSGGTAQVYLDVSGSMNAEMPLIVQLLSMLSRYVRRPFWAFSDDVAPATIVNGQLKAETSGGTSMACVLKHIARTRPASAVVVTDGYIEKLPGSARRAIGNTRLHAIISRDGSPVEIRRAGIPYTQLARLPS
jgi:hypothetical protein